MNAWWVCFSLVNRKTLSKQKKTSESADKPFQNREQESIAHGNGLVFLPFCGLDSIILSVQWYSLFP